MFSRLLFSAAFALTACEQNAAAQVEVANLREDVRGLVQRVGDLSLRVEQLELENSALRRKSKEGVRAYATMTQLNEAVADLNRMVKSAVSTSQDVTSPEQLEPDVDVTKWSASALYTQAIGEGALSLTGAFARKDNSENVTLDAWLGEAAWKLNPDWTIFSRAEAIEIGYGSQCWKDDVTPRGSDLLARTLWTADAGVRSTNVSHSAARSAATRSRSTGVDEAGMLRQVAGS